MGIKQSRLYAKNKITDKKTKYLRLGYTQNPRKVEMAKCGAAITKKRGLQAYDPKFASCRYTDGSETVDSIYNIWEQISYAMVTIFTSSTMQQCSRNGTISGEHAL